MGNGSVLEQVEIGELIQSVDDSRVAADPFKVIVAMRTTLDTRLADLKTKDAATLLGEGDRAWASVSVRAALDQCNAHLINYGLQSSSVRWQARERRVGEELG